jgi:hypothetical protein
MQGSFDASRLCCGGLKLYDLNLRHAILLSHDMPKAMKYQWVVGRQPKHSLLS